MGIELLVEKMNAGNMYEKLGKENENVYEMKVHVNGF